MSDRKTLNGESEREFRIVTGARRPFIRSLSSGRLRIRVQILQTKAGLCADTGATAWLLPVVSAESQASARIARLQVLPTLHSRPPSVARGQDSDQRCRAALCGPSPCRRVPKN